jgi:hypothetical protein
LQQAGVTMLCRSNITLAQPVQSRAQRGIDTHRLCMGADEPCATIETVITQHMKREREGE